MSNDNIRAGLREGREGGREGDDGVWACGSPKGCGEDAGRVCVVLDAGAGTGGVGTS